eukprot:8304125-Pyramimonas_sp.AAC.1
MYAENSIVMHEEDTRGQDWRNEALAPLTGGLFCLVDRLCSCRVYADWPHGCLPQVLVSSKQRGTCLQNESGDQRHGKTQKGPPDQPDAHRDPTTYTHPGPDRTRECGTLLLADDPPANDKKAPKSCGSQSLVDPGEGYSTFISPSTGP